MAGSPWSVTTSRGAFDRRALRAKRCSQERRQCARSALVNTFSRLRKGFGWRELKGVFQAEGLATDHFEPGSPDATAWPVAPEHGSKR